MAIKQIPLRGITRMPDDYAGGGGNLMHAVNMANDGAGLHLIEEPQVLFSLKDGEKCVYIHEAPGYKHFIVLSSYSGLVDRWTYYYQDGNEYVEKGILYELSGKLSAISSVGNTLVINDNDGIRYYVFSDGKYLSLGRKPPFIDIQFGLVSEFDFQPKVVDKNLRFYGSAVFEIDKHDPGYYPIPVYSIDEIGDYEPPTLMPRPYDVAFKEWHSNLPWENTFLNYDWKEYSFSFKDTKSGLGDTSKLDEMLERMNDTFLGHVNKLIARASEERKFVYPFYVRYSYELFDGSNIMHSYPVLMIPNSRGPIFALDYRTHGTLDKFSSIQPNGGEYEKFVDEEGLTFYVFKVHAAGMWIHKYKSSDIGVHFHGRAYGFKSELVRKIVISEQQKMALHNWKDIIRGVNIYITAPVYTYDQGGQVWGWRNMDANTTYQDALDGNWDLSEWKSYYSMTTNGKQTYHDMFEINGEVGEDSLKPYVRFRDDYPYPSYIMSLPEKDYSDISDDLINKMQFYKIASFTIEDLQKIGNKEEPLAIKENVIKNLVNQPTMDDDYHSHDSVASGLIYAYNNRVNLGGVDRTLHAPIAPHIQLPIHNVAWEATTAIQIAVYITDSDSTKIVISDLDVETLMEPWYLFYPNRNATQVVIKFEQLTGVPIIKKYELTESPSLEGAYWMRNLWGADSDNEPVDVDEFPEATDDVIIEHGKIYTSNQDNPFTFQPQNINTVGDGEVRALCANTQAVNSYNFGYATMYAFTDKGIWGLKVNDTGGFQSVQPITRDVITPGTKPLPLGQSIVFLASNGVLRIDINSSLTKLMSAQLGGIVDADIPKLHALIRATQSDEDAEAMIAVMDGIGSDDKFFWLDPGTKMMFDYRNSRVYFSNGRGSIVYNLLSDTYTQSLTTIDGALNSWPSCEFQQGQNIVSLDINERYKHGLFITRPLLMSGEYYSRVTGMVYRGNFSAATNEICSAIFGTRDFKNYPLIATSQNARITRHFGSGFRAHICYGAVGLDKGEKTLSVDGIAIDIEPSETNKLR